MDTKLPVKYDPALAQGREQRIYHGGVMPCPAHPQGLWFRYVMSHDGKVIWSDLRAMNNVEFNPFTFRWYAGIEEESRQRAMNNGAYLK